MLELLIAGTFFAAAATGLGLRVMLGRERRIKRALRSIKPTPIRDVKDGKAVKIVGELVYAGRSIPSGLSLRACAYYSVQVQQFRNRGSRGGRWKEILREEKGVDFYLRDETGMALVRVAADGKDFAALVQDRKARTSPIFADDPDLARFMAERGRSVEGSFFRRTCAPTRACSRRASASPSVGWRAGCRIPTPPAAAIARHRSGWCCRRPRRCRCS